MTRASWRDGSPQADRSSGSGCTSTASSRWASWRTTSTAACCRESSRCRSVMRGWPPRPPMAVSTGGRSSCRWTLALQAARLLRQPIERRRGCSRVGCVFDSWVRIGWRGKSDEKSRLATVDAPPQTVQPASGGGRWLLSCSATGEQHGERIGPRPVRADAAPPPTLRDRTVRCPVPTAREHRLELLSSAWRRRRSEPKRSASTRAPSTPR